MGRHRQPCECGNEKKPGQNACAECERLDEERRALNNAMRLRHQRETRAAAAR